MRKSVKIIVLVLITLCAFALMACEKKYTVAEVITLIDLAKRDDENSIDLALKAFEGLPEIQKRAVSNYMKLFYLAGEIPIVYKISPPPVDEPESLIFFSVPFFRNISSLDELIRVFHFVDLTNRLDEIDESIFNNKTVFVTTEISTWEANTTTEQISFHMNNNYDRLYLRFTKQGSPILGVASNNLRIIVFDTVYPIKLFDILFIHMG